MISESDFERDYQPCEALLDYNQVKDLPLNTVWTIIEGGDNDNWYALPGFHIVNKVGYITTTKPWTTGREEALWFDADN